MTREEAIKFLTLMRKAVSNFEEYGHDKASMVIECDKAEALDMAIEALQREEAEEKGYCHRIKPKEYFSADAVQGWITDRNPTENGTYIVTIADEDGGFVCELHYGEPLLPICKVNGSCWYDSDDEFGDCPYYDIIAWMPLPTPYKGGDDE